MRDSIYVCMAECEIISMNYLSLIYCYCRDGLEKALKIYERFGKHDADYVQESGFVLSGLGSSYRFLGQFKKAEGLLKKALATFKSLEFSSDLRVSIL